jgi:hypothetical protein
VARRRWRPCPGSFSSPRYRLSSSSSRTSTNRSRPRPLVQAAQLDRRLGCRGGGRGRTRRHQRRLAAGEPGLGLQERTRG